MGEERQRFGKLLKYLRCGLQANSNVSGLQHHSPCESGDRAVTIHCLLGLGHSCLRYNKEFSTTVTKPKGFHAYAISLCHLSRRLRGRKNTVVMYQAPVFIEYRNNNIKKAL